MENVSKNIKGLGLRLGQCRTSLGLSQGQLADMLGISRPNYTAIENENDGRFLKDYQLKKASQKLGVSSDYLLGLISDPNPNAEIMAITKISGLSSLSIYKLNSFLGLYHSDDILNTIDNFIDHFESKFWELICLYKKFRSFYNQKYKLILQFTDDISFPRLNFFSGKVDFSKINPHQKYFYYDIKEGKKFYDISTKMLTVPKGEFNKNFEILCQWLKDGKYTEDNLYLYDDCEKQKQFKDSLEYIKNTLHDLIMLLDFDETGLIFSLAQKEEEIRTLIDKLINLISSASKEPIDRIIENLWSCLTWFSQTIDYSLNFIKFRINNNFSEYLEKI